MHRIDGDANVAGMFDEGDPGVPRQPTQITAAWLNDVQEEIANVITATGAALVKGTQNQLKKAVGLLGSGPLAAAGARYFNDLLNVTLTTDGTAISGSAPSSTATDAGVKGHGDLCNGVHGTTYDGAAVNAEVLSSGTGDAFRANGPLDIGTAPVKQWLRLTKLTAWPSSPVAGDLAYVDVAGTNKLYFYDGGAWNALW
ncbi:MAG: hypothetical protein AB1730_26810 [Myxococcota bacterium]